MQEICQNIAELRIINKQKQIQTQAESLQPPYTCLMALDLWIVVYSCGLLKPVFLTELWSCNCQGQWTETKVVISIEIR